MKKNTFLVLGLLALTVTTVFAQAKPPKVQKIIDSSVPFDQSAILYFPKDSMVLMFNDVKFGLVGPVSVKNLAGKGGQNASQYKIADPILQVPAGKHSVVAAIETSQVNTPVGLRKVTYTFEPGHYYQMATVFNNVDVGEAAKKIMAELYTKGMDWCFVDITDEIKAGKKDYKEKWESLVSKGEMGKDNVIEPFVVTDASAYAPAKPVKAKKTIMESIPYEQSAFLYFDKEFQVLKFNDITYPKLFGRLTGDGKSDGPSAKIVKPLMQIPAGKQTIVASAERKYFGKQLTYTFLPGHHYQAVRAMNLDISKGFGNMMFGAIKDSIKESSVNYRPDWYFIDITYYLMAGLKNFNDMYTYESVSGSNGKDQAREDWDWFEIEITNEGAGIIVN
ncbi:MAG: hypothetical protein LBB89_00535 [Treponema sp.]|jgi:hypothetical protein|nr:hypothetical protein [Treponema sp.]